MTRKRQHAQALMRGNEASARAHTALSAEVNHHMALMLNAIIADAVALSLKTRSCYRQMIGTQGRDYYHPLGEHGNRLIAISDLIAERVRRQGGFPRSIGHGIQGCYDSADWPGRPSESLAELIEVNRTFSARLGEAHELCADYGDTATAALIEFWLAETEHRLSFLFEALRCESQSPH